MQLDNVTIKKFCYEVLRYYAKHGRHDLPWRQPERNGRFDPYKILVSELMLQQTQVSRVIPKYHEFLQEFPNVTMLAKAPLGQVITTWSGLGYNRRAKYLHEAAKQIAALPVFPNTITELVKLPGVGKNTAGAVLAYSFNEPIVFIETNIRTVYIHHFFADRINITDTEIAELLEQTLDRRNPREFYWALMDYGTHLKRSLGNLNKLSKHYTKQSKFTGSLRQLRGQVLRDLASGPLQADGFTARDERLQQVLDVLVAEELIVHQNGIYRL